MKYALLTVLLLGTMSKINAQQKDFSGTWVLNDHQSISGKLYANGVPRLLKIKQDAGSVILEKETPGMDNTPLVSSDTLYLEGKPFETITPSKRKKIITVKWAVDNASLLQQAVLFNPTKTTKIDMKIQDNLSIQDGNLVIIRKNENLTNGEVWESKAVYKKQ